MKNILLLSFIIWTGLSQANVYTVINTNDAGAGSLRQAIGNSNLNLGPDSIVFDIPGTAPHTIGVLSSFPTITDMYTIIDGTTQPPNGFPGPGPKIVIDGAAMANGNGLYATGAYFELYGLHVRNFPYRGIRITGASYFIIGKNGMGNVIGGNGYNGVLINNSSFGQLNDNKIGTNVTATVCDGNGYEGISIENGSNDVSILNNVITCNGYDGIEVDASMNCVIQRNNIGPLDANCSGSGYNGIEFRNGAQYGMVGGTAAGEGNIIAGNDYAGVTIRGAATLYNTVSGNSMFCNDPGNGGYTCIRLISGGNGGMPAPVITGATGGTIAGTSQANAVIQVFRNQDPGAYGCTGSYPMQGSEYWGTTTADGAGNWTINGTFTDRVTATATDASGNTSPFANGVSTNVNGVPPSPCGQPAALAANFNTAATTICVGDCINFLDQSAGSPISWTWTFPGATPNASVQQNPLNICFNSVGPHNVQLIVSDGNTIDTLFMPGYITVGAIPIASSVDTNISCFGLDDGSIDLTASGGTPPFTYDWTNNATTEDISGLSAGTYTVTVMDANGCTVVTSATITEPAVLTGTISSVPPTGNCDGTATANPTGGTPSYTYLWAANANNQVTQEATSLCPGTYCVTVTDANNCTWDNCIVLVTGIPEIDFITQLKTFPNPSNGMVTVEISSTQNQQITLLISNALGQEVYKKQLGIVVGTITEELDLSLFDKGVYNLQVSSSEGVITRKLLLE